MKYQISKSSGEAAYLQLYRQIRRDITDGTWHYGDRLPSKRMLAEETGTSVITTEHAYTLLEEEGYIEARERSGYYVCYLVNDAFGSGSSADTGTPASSEPFTVPADEFPFSVYARTMRRVLTEYGERIMKKAPMSGCPELRSALADYLARSRGIRVTSDQILIGSGSEYLYSLIPQLLGRNRVIALEDPSYEKIRKVYEANGLACDLLKMGPSGIESRALASSHATVLHVTPFHSYPSGVTADASKRQEYIHWAAQRGGYVIEDDYDSEFTMSTKAEETLFSLEPLHTVFYLNTFTRTISSSLRVGYMVLPSELSASLLEKISFYSCTVPVFDQLVLAEFIRNGDFERHINRVRRRRRKTLRQSV